MKKGFTLLELLIVIAIIGILISILVPSLQKSRTLARLAVCQSNMKQQGTGLITFMNDNDYTLPRYDGPNPFQMRNAKHGTTYTNLGSLYSGKYITDTKLFYCPEHQFKGVTSYIHSNYLDENDNWITNSGGDGDNSDAYIRVSYQLFME
ncbi:MAG: prepilin-type N-terminal cleavage/methylation domain-containing protein [Lentisphaeraceae bacterium]|nr:prepilin-type N-terminal cleavage/methylation domain-containing protein [Lentisphaeraceae bacterium]